MDKKQHALAALRDEFHRWEALLAGMSEAQITATRPPLTWSIKDVVVHLRAWQQVSIARVEAALHDAQPVMPDWLAGQDPESEEHREQFNATIYSANRDFSWSDVHGAWRDGFLRFVALAEAVPEHDLLAMDKYAWIKGYALVAVLEGSLGHHREHREELDAVDPLWKNGLWQQFGAAIDMLEDAIRACPDEHWQDRMWTFEAQFSQFWYIAYHALFWLDLYLSGPVEGFQPPPFTLDELDPAGVLPPRVYSKAEILDYLHHIREKCHNTIAALTNARAREMLRFGRREHSYAEWLLYNMRHVQEHGAQLSMYLGQLAERDSRWVGKAKS